MVDALLGMMEDFLGIVYRREGETDESLYRRGKVSARAFDEELVRMGISKQELKDSPTGWEIVWLGMRLDTIHNTISVPESKVCNTVLFFHTEIFSELGGFKEQIDTRVLDKLIGVLCHYSQASPLGKTLLWPLYMLLSEYRGTEHGKRKILEALVELDGECKKSLMAWYDQLKICGISKTFFSCKGTNSVTVVELWWTRLGNKTKQRKGKAKKGSYLCSDR